MMEKIEGKKLTDKEKLEAIMGMLNPRNRSGDKQSQEVIFKVRDNCELRYVISCLLRVCVSALEIDGQPNSPRLPFYSNEHAVGTILELIDNILPDDQLESYDAIEKLLLFYEDDK